MGWGEIEGSGQGDGRGVGRGREEVGGAVRLHASRHVVNTS